MIGEGAVRLYESVAVPSRWKGGLEALARWSLRSGLFQFLAGVPV